MNHNTILCEPNFGLISHQGIRGDANDDSCDFFSVECAFPVHKGPNPQTIHIVVIADGVSATKNGTQAARIATATIRAQLRGGPGRTETLSEWLESSVQQANDEILYESKRTPAFENMSTTIVVAALAGLKLYIMHLGDSRAYLLRHDQIFRLTADHTWTAEAMAVGAITEEEAVTHPARNQLQRYLGAKTTVQVDRGVIDPATKVHEEYILLQSGDMVLICTDGVHGLVTESSMQEVIGNNVGYPQDGVEELVALALEAGERDDITAILLELPPPKKVVPTGNYSPEVLLPGSLPNRQDTNPTIARKSLRALLWIAMLLIILTLVVYALGYL